MKFWSQVRQYISKRHSKDGWRRRIWEHTDRLALKTTTTIQTQWLQRKKRRMNWSARAPAGILQTRKASKRSLFLQGKPLLAPKLHLNGRRFKHIPLWISSPHISPLFLHPWRPRWELSTLHRRLKPHPTTVSPPPNPTLHSPSSALICDSSSTVV